jgi:hypothetical protein
MENVIELDQEQVQGNEQQEIVELSLEILNKIGGGIGNVDF